MSDTMSGTMSDTVTVPSVTQSSLDDLRSRVAGVLHTPGDATWDAARAAWTLNVAQHPLAVLAVRDAGDVTAAVRWAVENSVQVTAQPTGHGASGDLRGTLLLRTRALDEIRIDVNRRTAWVGAGVKAGELGAALAGTGLTFLAGSNPDPTVVGMTITGGISWFGRAFGLGSDSIVGFDLVDGLGRMRHVTAAEDPALFWAVRGGGGDFGILTGMEVVLHPAPRIYGGRLLWPVEHMGDVLRAFRTVTAAAPDELTVWFHAYRFPPFPEVPEQIRGQAFASVAVAHLGTRDEAEALLAPLRAIPGLALDLMGDVPVERLGDIADEPTVPTPGMLRSVLIDRLDEATLTALVDVVGPGSGSPLPIVQIRHLGGAFATDRADGGSHGAIGAAYHLQAVGIPAVPELVPVIAAALDRVGRAVAPVSTGRSLLNFLDPGEPSAWWDEQTRAALVAVKQHSDPLDTIRSNRPVRS